MKKLKYPLVTGAAGSIGKEYVKRLSKKGNVYAMVRKNADFDKFKKYKNVIPVMADLSDLTSLKKALKNVSIIYHTAASVSNNPRLTKKNTTEGTINLASAANINNVDHIHLISSISVYGSLVGVINEDSPINPEDSYGKSKLAQEEIIFNPKNKFTSSAVRPANVVGPAINLWTHFILNFIEGISVGKLPKITPPLFLVGELGENATFPYVEINNLIDLSILAANSPKAAGQIFIAIDDNSTWTKIINVYAKGVLGKKIHQPSGALRPILILVSYGLAVLGQTTGNVSVLRLSKYFTRAKRIYSGKKANDLLGYKTRVTLAESVRETREFVKRNGIIKNKYLL